MDTDTKAHSIYWFGSIRRMGPSLVVLFSVATLTMLGLIVLFSATHGQYGDPYSIVRKQVMWLIIALTAFVITVFIDLEKMRSLVWPLAVLTGGLLVLVLVPSVGKEVNGARRWLSLGPMNMQVSDFAKISLVFVLAHYLSANQRYLTSFFRGFFYPCMIIGTVFLLVLREPDFGTAFLLGSVGFVLLFLAGARLVYLLPTLLTGGSLFALAIYIDPVRLKRVTAFLDVEAHKADGAYQLWQGILAFGAGGIHGVGLGNGRQQNAFLPEAHTDFIFPIIGEELGLFFTAGVVAMFLFIFITCAINLRRAPNMFQFLLVAGALLLITFQALINFGVVTGCLPTKGMSLPFISYGGSNLLSMFILIGIVVNCFRLWGRSPIRKPVAL